MRTMGRAVAMEWVKTRTTATWWGLLLIALGLVALGVVLLGAFAAVDPPAPGETDPTGIGIVLSTPEGQRALIGTGFQNSYLLSAVLGAIVGAVDFRHRTSTWTFLVVPRRGVVAVAKLVVAGVVGLGYGIAVQAASLGLAALTLAGRDVELQLDADLWRSLALGVVGVTTWALVGVAVGLLLRNQVAAVLLVIGWVFLLDPIASTVLSAVGEAGGVDFAAVAQYTPTSASTAIVEGAGLEVLPWWGGLLVLLGYTAALTIPAVAVSQRRDVT